MNLIKQPLGHQEFAARIRVLDTSPGREIVTELEKLLERMRRIEALYVRTDVPGERVAAGNALEGILKQIQEQQQVEQPIEYQLSIGDVWSRRLFMALARRYKLSPYRYPRQRHSSIMIKAPKSFIENVLWPEFQQLWQLLSAHLSEVTEQVISQGLGTNGAEAPVVEETAIAISGPQAK